AARLLDNLQAVVEGRVGDTTVHCVRGLGITGANLFSNVVAGRHGTAPITLMNVDVSRMIYASTFVNVLGTLGSCRNRCRCLRPPTCVARRSPAALWTYRRPSD